MRAEVNRLKAGGSLSGSQIDRGKLLRFSLDGRVVTGFAGDTVLSALLANGVDTAGTLGGSPLALGSSFAPPVALASGVATTLPMERLPARDGLELVTLSPRANRGPLGFLNRNGSSLGLHLERATRPAWQDEAIAETLRADMVVVGGGVAGLSAALAAGQSGSSVILVERRQNAGGNARLFGSMEDEETPDAMTQRLIRALGHLANVTVLALAEALSVEGQAVRVHQVLADGRSRMLRLESPRIVLATGTFERLPVFSGNRLPNVTRLLEAFDRADRFGVWTGRSTVFNTAVSPAYRLAMLALDNGLAVARMSDTRLRPQSRFIEFSKAYGIPLASGLVPRSASPARHGGLEIRLVLEMENYARAEPAIAAEQLIVGGGWQPDLALWLSAGGHVRWDRSRNQLVANETLTGIALAGAAAGYRSLSGCAQSGVAAVAALFGRAAVPVFDIEIDPAYESPDGPTPVTHAAPDDEVPAWLDGDHGLSARSVPPKPAGLLRRPTPEIALSETPHDLTLGELAANIGLGRVAEREAGAIARERCLSAQPLPQSPPLARHRPERSYPAYLDGRFGKTPALWRLVAEDARQFEAGALLHANSDAADPRSAAGVIVGPAPDGGAVALVAEGEADKRLVLRGLGQQVPVRLVEKL